MFNSEFIWPAQVVLVQVLPDNKRWKCPKKIFGENKKVLDPLQREKLWTSLFKFHKMKIETFWNALNSPLKLVVFQPPTPLFTLCNILCANCVQWESKYPIPEIQNFMKSGQFSFWISSKEFKFWMASKLAFRMVKIT